MALILDEVPPSRLANSKLACAGPRPVRASSRGRLVGRLALPALAAALIALPAGTQTYPTVHYDVVVRVTSSFHTEHQMGTAGLEVNDATVRSSARWPNIGFRIISQGGKAYGVTSITPSFPGTILASATFTHQDAPKSYKAMGCKGAVTQSYKANLSVIILLGLGGVTDKITFLGQPFDAGMEFARTIEDAKKSSCGDGYFKVGTVNPTLHDFTLPDGVKFSPVSGALVTNWTAEGKGGPPFPIDQILAGKPFVIDSGRQTSPNGDTSMTYQVEFLTPCPTCGVPPIDNGPTPPPPPKNPCNPDLMADADRKWKTAQELFKAAADHQKEAIDEFNKWKTEEAKTMAELGLEKNDLLKIVELALEEGGKHLLHRAAGVFGLVTTAAWIYTDVQPHVRDHNQMMRDAAKMTDAAGDLAASSIKDMNDAFAQDPACEDLRQKTIAREKLLDQAKALREKWAQEGSALYKDPNDPNPYPMDAKAALDRAIQILNEKSKASDSPAFTFSLASFRSPGLAPPGLSAFQNNGNDPGVIVTVEQARRALAQIDAAIAAMNAGRASMAKRKSFADKQTAALNALLANWK